MIPTAQEDVAITGAFTVTIPTGYDAFAKSITLGLAATAIRPDARISVSDEHVRLRSPTTS